MKKLEKNRNWVVSRCFGWAFEVYVGPMLEPLVTHTAVHKGFWEGKKYHQPKRFRLGICLNHFSGLVGPMLGLWWAGFGRFGKFGEGLVGFGWL